MRIELIILTHHANRIYYFGASCESNRINYFIFTHAIELIILTHHANRILFIFTYANRINNFIFTHANRINYFDASCESNINYFIFTHVNRIN